VILSEYFTLVSDLFLFSFLLGV
jgi:hypothetical protein